MGYALIAVLWLQALSIAVIAALQYTLFNGTSKNLSFTIEDVLSLYLSTTTAAKPDNSNLFVTIVLWILLIGIVVILAVFVAKVASSIVKSLAQRLYGKVTSYNLLMTKIVSILLAIMIISFSALLLPAVEYILPLNLIFAGVGVVAFLLQHWLAKRHKTPVKQLL